MVSDWLMELDHHLDPKDLIGRQEFLSCQVAAGARFYFSIRDESSRLLPDRHLLRQTEHQLGCRLHPELMIGYPIRMKNLKRLNGISDK